jgi:S1-C subfamily serine protease
MLKSLIGIVAMVAMVMPAQADDKVVNHLQTVSVTVGAGRGTGSGILITRGGVNFVWTAAHVVDGLRKTREVIDGATGTKRVVVEFDDAKVIQMLIEDGRKVGQLEFDAKVIRYSDADNGEDLAILMVRKKNLVSANTVFYNEKENPSLGTDLWHVGSLLGQMGANSLTSGIVSQHGRLHGGKVFDQTTVTAFPGSSGGGVFTKDGRYVGMLVRGAGEQFNLIVPIRRMRDWAKKAKVEWALDEKLKMPSAEELEKMPIEDTGFNFKSSFSADKKPDGNAGDGNGANGEEKKFDFKFLLGPAH